MKKIEIYEIKINKSIKTIKVYQTPKINIYTLVYDNYNNPVYIKCDSFDIYNNSMKIYLNNEMIAMITFDSIRRIYNE